MKALKVVSVAIAFTLLFLGAFFWPALRDDWDYWQAKRAFRELRLGETKAKVRDLFGLPPFTELTDRCWYDRRTLWPGSTRLYTLCFDHGRLASKTYSDD